ncbi:tripartite tricarboxylate transporter permease [Ornithinimicrobium cavernae]|uniref:tripartite tricarboxylate transporter permease n=1 Tax=Ornithinimicrobium cavernae TaxID=2666047 RepID=UPI000D69F4D7|nr:tripartite tricarboxylate transporter permease [Ornithinimicrobium cavernae]
MSPIDGLLLGLEVAFQPQNLLAAFIGVLVGTVVGVLPGLGPTAGAAILFPITLTMDPVAGVILIAGIYYGTMYGGSTTAILLNIPGESSAIVSTFEGYPMARQGRGGPALATVALGSFFTGTLTVILVTFFTPEVARFGLMFGPPEYFALTFGGLLLLARVMGGSLVGGLLPMLVGLLLGTIGGDPTSGIMRFTFGEVELTRGISLVPVAIGLFGVAELLRITYASSRGAEAMATPPKVGRIMPSRDDLRRSLGPWARGGILGFVFGLLPGPSGTLSTFVSYRVEKSLSKRKHMFGKGAIEGLSGPEAANNAAATSSVIPILAFGIPFSSTLALMLAALIAQGVQPGPQIAVTHPEIFWGVIASMYIGNVMCLVLNLPLVRIWVKLLQVPTQLLFPAVMILAAYGAYAASGIMIDLVILVGLGFVGYLFGKIGFQIAPLLVGVILGPMVENNFVASMTLGRGDFGIFWASTPSKVMWGMVIVIILLAAVARRFNMAAAGVAPAHTSDGAVTVNGQDDSGDRAVNDEDDETVAVSATRQPQSDGDPGDVSPPGNRPLEDSPPPPGEDSR